MVDFEKGQTFLNHQAVDPVGKKKAKYFIGLSSANELNDDIVCFVMNTERRFEKYTYNCNLNALRFIIRPKTFSFITRNTSIMLNREAIYSLSEIYESHIQLLDKADDVISRQIKNCINWVTDVNYFFPSTTIRIPVTPPGAVKRSGA